jgi:hypothetical protein
LITRAETTVHCTNRFCFFARQLFVEQGRDPIHFVDCFLQRLGLFGIDFFFRAPSFLFLAQGPRGAWDEVAVPSENKQPIFIPGVANFRTRLAFGSKQRAAHAMHAGVGRCGASDTSRSDGK